MIYYLKQVYKSMIIKQLILLSILLNANSPNTIFTNVKINSSIVTVVDNRCYVEYPIVVNEFMKHI